MSIHPSSDNFDPLGPSLYSSSKTLISVCTAFAPFCVPLGLPQGYTHARDLLARFSKARAKRCTAPSFDNDVLPTLRKLKSPNNQAILAEYCTLQCDGVDEQKLICLDNAIEFAMQASSEIEAKLSRNPSDDFLLEEQMATSTVKRLTTSKSILSDKCHVIDILRSNRIDSDQYRTVKSNIDDLTSRLNLQLLVKPI